MDKITQRVYESPSQAVLQQRATQEASQRFNGAVAELKHDFEDNLVTQEIDRGIGSPNISHTLRGGDAPESLYGFIGFKAGDQPTKPIRDRLDPSHADGPKMRLRGKETRGTAIRYQFVVDAPNEEKIYKATPLSWAPGMSWAEKIETGIAGFNSFLDRFGAGKSGGGIQAKKKDGSLQTLREGEYVPPVEGYIQTMLRKFADRFRS